MANRDTIRVDGLKELQAAFAVLDNDVKLGLDAELKEVAEEVAEAARALMDQHRFNPKSVAGIKSRVRPGRSVVEQQLRKTTGNRPDWGALQMTKGLLPALEEKEPVLVERVDRMVHKAIEETGF